MSRRRVGGLCSRRVSGRSLHPSQPALSLRRGRRSDACAGPGGYQMGYNGDRERRGALRLAQGRAPICWVARRRSAHSSPTRQYRQ
jgi:hypothetical protein